MAVIFEVSIIFYKPIDPESFVSRLYGYNHSKFLTTYTLTALLELTISV